MWIKFNNLKSFYFSVRTLKHSKLKKFFLCVLSCDSLFIINEKKTMILTLNVHKNHLKLEKEKPTSKFKDQLISFFFWPKSNDENGLVF